MINGDAFVFHGHALIALYRARRDLVPVERQANFRGGVSAVMLVNYTSSPVGPYRELLYVGGFFREAGLLRPSVTRILVDSVASMNAGRTYWGLPKELASFTWEDNFVRVKQDGRFVAEFAWKPGRYGLPVTLSLIPPPLRTLAQPLGARTLLTTPGGAGRVQPAHLDSALVNPSLFPDVNGASPLLTLAVPRFALHFPPARNRNQ